MENKAHPVMNLRDQRHFLSFDKFNFTDNVKITEPLQFCYLWWKKNLLHILNVLLPSVFPKDLLLTYLKKKKIPILATSED